MIDDYPTSKRQVRSRASIDPEVAEEIREEYISHEAAVRSISILYFINAAIFGMALLAVIFDDDPEQSTAELLIATIFLTLFFYAFLQAGIMMRNLDPRIRRGAIILSSIGLLLIPVALIHVYILYFRTVRLTNLILVTTLLRIMV